MALTIKADIESALEAQVMIDAIAIPEYAVLIDFAMPLISDNCRLTGAKFRKHTDVTYSQIFGSGQCKVLANQLLCSRCHKDWLHFNAENRTKVYIFRKVDDA